MAYRAQSRVAFAPANRLAPVGPHAPGEPLAVGGAAPGVVRTDAWRAAFPVGVYVDCNNLPDATWPLLLTQPDGVAALGLDAFFLLNFAPWWQGGDTGVDWLAQADAGKPYGRTRLVVLPNGRYDAAGNSLDGAAWYGTAHDPAFHTAARADALAPPVLDALADNPSVLHWSTRDDAIAANRADDAATMALAFERYDPKRPASATYIQDVTVSGSQPTMRLFVPYAYPCGVVPNTTTPTQEGDFHSGVFESSADHGGGGGDWIDYVRGVFGGRPAGCQFWMGLQAMGRTSGFASDLDYREPTVNEYAMQAFMAIGEGAHGIFWFAWDTQQWWRGLDHPNRADARAAVAAVASRLTPVIRARLLGTAKVADAFATTGGGSSGYPVNYPRAYVSTLKDAAANATYAVVVSRSSSATTVTLSSGTLSGGYLIDLETGERFKLGDAIPFAAFGCRLFWWDADVGVPRWRPRGDETASASWDAHRANPASPNSRATINPHPKQVTATDGNLQALVDGVPDNTTIYLPGGIAYQSVVDLIGRHGIHFVAQNPANRPVLHTVHVLGMEMARRYHGATVPYGMLHTMIAAPTDPKRTTDFLRQWKEPPATDIHFKGIDFVSDGTPVFLVYDFHPGDNVYYRSWYQGTAITFRVARDCLVEDCTFRGYAAGNDNGPPPAVPTIDASLTTPGEGGMVMGDVNCTNVVVRNCTFGVSETHKLWFGTFFDGARGCVFYGNDFRGGSWQSGHQIFFCNDDYTWDVEMDGQIDRWLDQRCAQYNCLVNNQYPATNGVNIEFAGWRNLVKGNTMTANASVPQFVKITFRCSKLWDRGDGYEMLGNEVIGNTVVNGSIVRAFLVYDNTNADGGCPGSPPAPNPARGRIGGGTVAGNTVTGGTVAAWSGLWPGQTNPLDVPDTVSGNTP